MLLNSFKIKTRTGLVKLLRKQKFSTYDLQCSLSDVVEMIPALKYHRNLTIEEVYYLFDLISTNKSLRRVESFLIRSKQDFSYLKNFCYYDNYLDTLVNKKGITYHKEYWMSLGYNEAEAVEQIHHWKKDKATSLEQFIRRHGEVQGTLAFNDWLTKCKITSDKFTTKYGREEGLNRWKAYLRTKDSNSFDWALKKAGGDYEKAKEIFENRKHGYVRDFSSLVNDPEALKTAKIYRDSKSFKWAIRRAGGDQELATKFYKFRQVNAPVPIPTRISKSSLRVFIPLYKFLRKSGFSRADLWFGVSGSREYYLWFGTGYFWYDFTILSKNVMIEFNGEGYHPNYEKYTIDELKQNWKHRFQKISVEDAIIKEQWKHRVAKEQGFHLLVLWDCDDPKTNFNKVVTFLRELGVINES